MKRTVGKKMLYSPDANDPNHLIYREAQAHRIKTNVRGDGAQYPDRVLIKRERRRLKASSPKKSKWPKGRKLKSRPFPKQHRPMRQR